MNHKGLWIGIDYGSKRTGLAISDKTQTIVFPWIVCHPKEVVSTLEKQSKSELVAGIVVGIPLQLNGESTDATSGAEKLVQEIGLALPGIPIFREDERLTSKIAAQRLWLSGLPKKIYKNKKNLDPISAAVILESFLNRCSSYKQINNEH